MMSASKFCSPASIRSVVAKQGYVTQAANAKVAQESASTQAKVTKLPSGLTVSSVENFSPVSKITVAVKAGSRHESYNSLGVSHALRNLSGFATQNSSAFNITRNLQQIGASIQTTTTREHMFFNLDCLRDKLDVGVKFLSEVALRPVFKHWEVGNNCGKSMELDLALRDRCPSTVILDLVHKAAYRTGLGNSLFSPEFMVGKHSSDMLQAFVSSHFTPENMVLVGTGIEHEELLEYANKVFDNPNSQDTPASSSGYHGDELRMESLGDLAYAAVVTEGASLKSRKEMLCLAILQQALGTGPHVKWAASDCGRLSKATNKSTQNPHAVSSLNINYSDSGLFGFVVAAQADEMDKVLKAVVSATSGITKNGLTDQEFKVAKKQLKASILFGLEGSESTIDEMALNAFNQTSESIDEINSAIDNLTSAELMTVAKKVINGKPSMAAIGNLSKTPYLDEL